MITNLNDNELRLQGEAVVLRELLAEAMTVMKTIESEDAHELSLLTDLIDKIEAALNPAAKGVLL